MIPRHYIYLALLVFAIVATTGCMTRDADYYDVSFYSTAVHNPPVGEESVNVSIRLPTRVLHEVPLPRSGTSYHVIVKTTEYNNVIHGRYSYQTTSQYTDRFGVHNTTTTHADVAMTGGEHYLGVSDNSRVIDTIVTIPAGAENPKLVFLHAFDEELYSNFDVSVTEVRS
jgi:hypothetical protein